MGYELLFALWFFAPAGLANPTPIVVSHLPWLRSWNTPLDCGVCYKGERLFGDNKTWRGLISAAIIGGLVFICQQQLAPHLGGFSVYLASWHYSELTPFLGVLMGVGALLGDAVESFFKRRRGIPAGRSWPPFDQVDYVVGACLFAAPVIVLPFSLYVWVLVIWSLMSLIFSYIGYRLHLKDRAI